jgi:hypothetical protein
MDIQKLIALWKSLADVPVNNEGDIDTNWHTFNKGTDLLDIWHWFEEQNKDFFVYKQLYGTGT